MLRSPVIRILAAIVAVAAGIRLIFWLLLPVLTYLAVGLTVFLVMRLANCYRDRL